MATAMRPTKLGAIIKECRKITRFIPFIERAAETDCILSNVNRADSMSLKGMDQKVLKDAVHGALSVADHVEVQQKKNPSLMMGQPEEQAAEFLRNALQLPDLLSQDP